MARKTTTTPAPVETPEATPEAQDGPVFLELPAKPAGGGNSGPSVWADRLNPIADHQAENPGMYAEIFTTKQPKGATVMASSIRNKLRKGEINGVQGGPFSFEIVTRGAVLYARFRDEDEAAKAQAAYEAKAAAKNGDAEAEAVSEEA